jgi:hypothetical protein
MHILCLSSLKITRCGSHGGARARLCSFLHHVSVCRTVLWDRNSQCHMWYQKKSRKCGFWSIHCSFMVTPCPSSTQQNIRLTLLVQCYKIWLRERIFGKHRNKIKRINFISFHFIYFPLILQRCGNSHILTNYN